MTKLMLSAAVAAVLAFSTPVLAQNANSNHSADATSNSGAEATANNAAINGPINNSQGPVDNSHGDTLSSSNSGAVSGSDSTSHVGNLDSSVRIGDLSSGPSTSNSESTASSQSSTASYAEGGSGGSANATGGSAQAVTGPSTSNAQNQASNAGNAQSITFNNVAPKKQKLETVPQVYAPALSTTLTETCMGSTSGGVSVLGFGGTLGTTWNDGQCVRRLNAREMAQTLGDREAARALLCMDKDVAAAYAAVGQTCHFPAPEVPRSPQLAAVQQAPLAEPEQPAPPPPISTDGTPVNPVPYNDYSEGKYPRN